MIYNNIEQVDHLWIESLKIVKTRLSETVFHLWIEPLFPLAAENGQLFVETPDPFFAGWVQNHYASLLLEAVRSLNPAILKIVFRPRLDKNNRTAPPQAEPGPGPAPARPAADGRPTRRRAGNLNPAYSFDNFIIGNSNRLAHAAALSVSQSPGTAYNPLFIYGPVGVGKTHLMQAIGSAINDGSHQVAYLSSEQFLNEYIGSLQTKSTNSFRNKFREMDLLLIDDIQFIGGKEETQKEFFHTFNVLYDEHKQVVLSCDRPPGEIVDIERRLVSRFEWGLVVDISPPDLETRVAIIQSKARGKNFYLPSEVAFCLAERLEGSVRVLEGALNKLCACASLYGRETVDVAFAREILDDLFQHQERKVSVSVPFIQEWVGKYYNVRLSELRGAKRSSSIIMPRQVAVYLARKLTGASLPALGESFGGRNHTTILYACRKIEEKIAKDVNFRAEVERLMMKIKQSSTT